MYHEMKLGSRGENVTVLHIFLFGVGVGKGCINMDQHYGEMTAGLVALLQRSFNIYDEPNCFGPKTRAAVEERFGFDFDAACEAIKYQPIEGVLTRSAVVRDGKAV